LLPTVSLLVVAHNEEADIERRVQNALALDYPKDKLELVFASDGSTDATPSILRKFERDGVRLLEFAERRGKACSLNGAFPKLNGEIVVLSDANSFTEPQAVRLLVRWFQDPAVGTVCGRLVLHDPRRASNVDGLYWKYETFLKRCESRLGALLGSNGAIYAIRKKLFTGIPNNTIVDDFVIPLLAKRRTGCRIVYESEAAAHEETPENISAEFQRRSRIGAGGFQSIGLLAGLFNPRHGWVAFTFVSHKLMRWICPFFLVGAAVFNMALLDKSIYRVALAMQAILYISSLLGALLPPIHLFKPIRLATMFVGMNVAVLVGFWRWLLGIQGGAWTRTARSGGVG
jgi:cellulose synthase/poly-beta-1,6-N-acetylglucosamine synthase-like glycosyltransferase